MRVGDIVLYTHTEGEDAAPAIVLRIWEDRTVQLYVFHFEGNVLIRAAHPTQIRMGELERDLEDMSNILTRRISMLEDRLEERLTPSSVDTPEQPPASEDAEDEELVESTVQPQSKRRKSAWPR